MDDTFIFSAGSTQGSAFAVRYMKELGLKFSEDPQHVRYLLLDVPSFSPVGKLRGGTNVDALFASLPKDIMICGGNLSHPALDGYETVDFLKDEIYLCQNAYITAECALDVALPYLGRTLRNCPVLILGWGRIGKCLGQLMKNIGADVTVAARNPGHRAMARALGYHTEDVAQLSLNHFRLIYNTVPAPVVSWEQMEQCRDDCIKIELASIDGMVGDDIIIARGLPGVHMPESSGKLIAETFLRLCYRR